MEYYLAIKMNEIIAFFKDMDGTREYYAKWKKSVRERQIPYDFTHVEFKKWKEMGHLGGSVS